MGGLLEDLASNGQNTCYFKAMSFDIDPVANLLSTHPQARHAIWSTEPTRRPTWAPPVDNTVYISKQSGVGTYGFDVGPYKVKKNLGSGVYKVRGMVGQGTIVYLQKQCLRPTEYSSNRDWTNTEQALYIHAVSKRAMSVRRYVKTFDICPSTLGFSSNDFSRFIFPKDQNPIAFKEVTELIKDKVHQLATRELRRKEGGEYQSGDLFREANSQSQTKIQPPPQRSIRNKPYIRTYLNGQLPQMSYFTPSVRVTNTKPKEG